MTTETRAAFARRKGWNRSSVTRAEQAGRLVMVGDLVDVEASLARLAATASPEKDHVAARHAAGRADAGTGQHLAAADDQPPAADGIGNSYQAARAVKEKYLALSAKTEYEKAVRLLIPRPEVEQALADVVAYARSGLENLPHRVAGDLVGQGYDQILARLKAEIVTLMGEMHADARRQLTTLTNPGDA